MTEFDVVEPLRTPKAMYAATGYLGVPRPFGAVGEEAMLLAEEDLR